ncbi:CdaR family protein [Natranaerovirga hydrolytica]|nr:CdaR family protein [Natranaerovirga hydrolytica]
MKKILTKNLMWKILSTLLAILLWLVVLNVEDPWTTSEVRDITVQLRSDESITNQNKAYEVLRGETISVRVEGKRSVIDSLTQSDITAIADMKMLSITNSVPIEVSSNKPIEIVRWEPQNLLVNVEDIRTIQASVQYQMVGEPNQPYVIGDVDLEPNIVQVTGPESQINRVKSIVVPVEIDPDNTRDIILDASPNILDEQGNEVSNVSLNTNNIKVNIRIDKERNIPIRLETVGELSEGFMLTDMSYSPTNIRLAGRESEVDAVNVINIDPIDITGMEESQNITIDIADYIPSNMRLVSDVSQIQVNLEIEEVIEREIVIPINNIDVKSLLTNYQFKFLTQEDIVLTLRGRASVVNNISDVDYMGTIELRGLEEGEHTVPVEVGLPRNVEIVGGDPEVSVQLEYIGSEDEDIDTQEEPEDEE